MKKVLLTAFFVFVGSLVFAQERIAVFPFEDNGNVLTREEAVMFYQEFSVAFANRIANRFTVIPRMEVDRLINTEAAFQLSEFSAMEKTAEMRRVLNGSRILSGRIGRLDNTIRITVSLFTFPELQQLPGGTTLSGIRNKNELFDKIPELVQNMFAEMTGTGNQTGQTDVPVNFVLVEGGTFMMGSPWNENGRNENEGPQHQVKVSSFYMGKYEVTQKEYRDVMGVNPSVHMYRGDNLPVECSWYDAIGYCNRLSTKEGLTPCYRGSGDNITCDWNANGYRLPTEAEWEYAAKGGNKDYLIFIYSGSNNPATVAWYGASAWKEGETTGTATRIMPVGTKSPNSLDIYDMSGNVQEWCWDWAGNYSNSVQIDPRGPASPEYRNYSLYEGDGYRVSRGGHYGNSNRNIRSSRRGFDHPASSFYLGFRIVRRS